MKTLITSDHHLPYVNDKFWKDFPRLLKFYKPDNIVFNGDLIDNHAVSHHKPDNDAMSHHDELIKSQDMMNNIFDLTKKYPVFYTIGNHEPRIEKVCADNHISRACLKSLRELYSIPSNWTIKDKHLIDNVLFVHGQSPVKHKTSLMYGKSTVQSHYHSLLEVSYMQSETQRLFSCFSGSCADDNSIGLSYAKNVLCKSAYGAIIIIDNIPQVIPL